LRRPAPPDVSTYDRGGPQRLEFTYSLIDRILPVSLGELADFSGALYQRVDFSLSLEEAQRRKHGYIAEQIGIGPGQPVLDLGCGWAPRGVTSSSAQPRACRSHGLDAHLQDARQVTRSRELAAALQAERRQETDRAIADGGLTVRAMTAEERAQSDARSAAVATCSRGPQEPPLPLTNPCQAGARAVAADRRHRATRADVDGRRSSAGAWRP
jgi:Mycolic acid cyclopropane synthetase